MKNEKNTKDIPLSVRRIEMLSRFIGETCKWIFSYGLRSDNEAQDIVDKKVSSQSAILFVNAHYRPP